MAPLTSPGAAAHLEPMLDPRGAARLADAARARTAELVAALRSADRSTLHGPSALPGWDRLTIACHLRYGAVASRRMTTAALKGRPAPFYPDGRSRQRPGTLVPHPGEGPSDVVGSLAEESDRLHDLWRRLSPEQWQTAVHEPVANPDLGRTTVVFLALLRLTEVEIHGTDLDLGLRAWSDDFVRNALPVRLGWLAGRRGPARPALPGVEGSWLLRATDGPCQLVSVHGDRVTSEPAEPTTAADAVIEGTSRDLLALLVGRPPTRTLALLGDPHLAAAFGEVFPGP